VNQGATPTLEDERVPTKDELKAIFSSAIQFNLDGIDSPWAAVQRASGGGGSATDWELFQIYQSKDAWSRISFWQGGSQVANPYG
jgi:hypothetical protein